MPYIDKEKRKLFKDPLLDLLSSLQGSDDEMCGELNYCISFLLYNLLHDKHKYSRVNALMGVMECASQEFYRRYAVPYEEEKIKQNGDVEIAERVLVVKRDVVDLEQGLMSNPESFMEKFAEPDVASFMLRHTAEVDPSFKQLIPYVIMSHGDKYFSYVRGTKSGESRLVGNRSIGIGGHINPHDVKEDFYATYMDAVRREVNEEVCVGTEFEEKIVAIINDDSNAVGEVHLGVIHHWKLKGPFVTPREDEIAQPAFMTLEELREARDSLETWSRLCVDSIHLLG